MGDKSGAKAARREAERARADEQARQQRVRQGTNDVNAIFDGGMLGANAGNGANSTQANALQTIFSGATFGGPSTPGRQVDGAFTDSFYKSLRDGFTNYAMPQLNAQRDDAARDLTFALDRSGQLNGSVRGQKTGELQRLFDLNEQQVRDQALSYENQTRGNVESARADLIGMLNATGDSQQAVNSALSRSSILTQPQAYSPIGQLFTDFTSQLGNQAARERSFAAGGPRPAYDTGLFGGIGRTVVRN